jgi:small conductance mechanosensitive channel
MFQTSAVETPAATPDAVQPSLAEQLWAFGRDAWDHLNGLDPGQVGLNFLISAAVVLAALGLVWALRRLFDRWLSRLSEHESVEIAESERRTPRAAGFTWGLLRLVVLLTALGMVAAVWGIDLLAWLSGEAGVRLIRLALIAVLATALVEVAGFVIGRFVEGFASRSRDSRRASQIRSLGPLLSGSVQAVLIVVGLLTVLSEIGVQVGPLLASAGVVGLALGFGAQTIVKDFLTGVFLIAEDAVSVGDNVKIGEASGTVESMTLRTIRLRNMDGTLHIFPYSEAQVIHNRTKVFSSYVFEVQVTYNADIDLALEVMAQVGDAMRSEPAFQGVMTKPFEVLGVDQLTDSGVLLKARATTRPKEQWKIGREYNRRVKLAFDAAGIEILTKVVQPAAPDVAPEPAPVVTPKLAQVPADGPAESRTFRRPNAQPSS